MDGETNTRLLSACGPVGHLCRSQRILVANESGRGTLSVRWNGVRQQRMSIGRLRPFLRSCWLAWWARRSRFIRVCRLCRQIGR